MAFCTKCGTQLADDVGFCGKCGTPVQAASEETSEIKGEVFTDPRDGRVYKTVKIGNQVWMAENLNYEVRGGFFSKKQSKFYNGDSKYGERYGRLYSFEAAKEACPPGWHLPSSEEWKTLFKATGNYSLVPHVSLGKVSQILTRNLRAKNGWNDVEGKSGNGQDTYGFAALPGGYYENDDGCFKCVGEYGVWWNDACEGQAFIGKEEEESILFVFHDKSLFSVRCVKN